MGAPIYGSKSPTAAAEKPNTDYQLDESNPEDADLYGSEIDDQNKFEVDPELEYRDIETINEQWNLIRGSALLEEEPEATEE